MSKEAYVIDGKVSIAERKERMLSMRVSTVSGLAVVLTEMHSVGFSLTKFNNDLASICMKTGLETLCLAQEKRMEILQEFHFLRGVKNC